MFGFIAKGIREDKREKAVFERGVEHGIEIGRQQAIEMAFRKSREVSQEKYDMLMKFLVENEIEIHYTQEMESGMRNCGLVIRERIYQY